MYSKVNKTWNMALKGPDFAICYSHDGKLLAEYIQQRFTDTRFGCSVDIIDFAEVCKCVHNKIDTLPFRRAKVNVLVVSPSFLASITSSGRMPCAELFPVPEKTAALYFYADEAEAERKLLDVCETSKKWTRKGVGNNKNSIRECLVTLMTLWEEDAITPLPVLKKFSLVPAIVSSTTESINIMFTQETRGKVEVKQDQEPKSEAVFYNPYTYVFTPKGIYTGQSGVEVFVNDSSVGTETLTYESLMEEVGRLLSDVSRPEELLCQAVLGADSSHLGVLDQTLVHMFCNSAGLPSIEQGDFDTEQKRQQEFPTMLHLAARFGLKDLCKSMIATPGGKIARKIHNASDLTPEDLARGYQHLSIVEHLQATKVLDCPDQTKEKEIYCDMVVESNKRMEAHGSASSISSCGSDGSTYMDMGSPKVGRHLAQRSTSKPDIACPLLPQVTLRQRSKTLSMRASRVSNRITMIKEEDIMFFPKLPRRDDRIYASINDLDLPPLPGRTSTEKETSNVRKP